MATKKDNTVSKSVYSPNTFTEQNETHTLSILVDDEPGVLARVAGLFSGRGYNIASLTVALVDPDKKLSRITIVSSGTPLDIEQIRHQLERLVPVHGVFDLTLEGPHVARELALIKVVCVGENRIEALRIADIFRARVVDSSLESFIFEVSGDTEKVNAFIEMMMPLGLTNLSRTGIAALMRGKGSLQRLYDDKENT